MTTVENLRAADAVEKMRSIVNDAPTCLFVTRLGHAPFHVCPMYAQEVDHGGCLWFFSGAGSAHNAHLEEDSRVQLLFANNDRCEFLAVFGRAFVQHDLDKVDELWGPMVKAWFPGGKHDPNLTLIRCEPEKVHYWDTRDNKLTALGKLLVGAVAGKTLEAGVEGDLIP